jgi:hypothetical protein
MTMTDMNPGTGAIGPCVSLATGTLSPDQRVNYAYGMVLGLDEFLQEQLHTLAKDYLHERALHGFGTVFGLAVAIAPVNGAPDFQISVTTGMANDQWGREIVVRCDQCVRLGAWLAAQERLSPGILGQHLGPSGEVTVYVVASYAECLDRLVPLPGQPCSSSDQVTVASRIRDAWDLELRWAPPAMPRWDTDRRLARLLAGVTVVAGLSPADSDETEITDAVRALAGLADDGPSDLDPGGPSGIAWRLPAETAAAALDRIFTVWVTQVRPALHPDLADPEAASDPAVLLSAVTFVPATPFDVGAPAITACDDPDDEGRPYLLHTELIQELRALSDLAEPSGPSQTADLVTLAAQVDSTNVLVVDAWFHLVNPVWLPGSIEVRDETGGDQPFSTTAVDPDTSGFSSAWKLRAPGAGVMTADGLQISALFPAAVVLVKDTTTTLAQVEQNGTTVLNADKASGDVTAYATVRGPAISTAPSRPCVEFVTVTSLQVSTELALIELWFHIEPHGVAGDAFAVKPEVRLFDDATGSPLQFQLGGPAPWSRNVWRAQITLPSPGKGIPLYIRHQYLPTAFGVEVPGRGAITLADWIAENELSYVGYEPDAEPPDIIAFSRIAVPNEIVPLDVPTPVAPTPVAPSPVAPMPVAPTPVAPTPVAPTPVAPRTARTAAARRPAGGTSARKAGGSR